MLKRLYYILYQRAYVLLKKIRSDQGRVYMMHKVSDDGDIYAISREHFSEFLNALCEKKKIVDLETLIREKNPGNVVISFDDVYESVYENAFPLLKKKGVPYYLFVCNEYLNKEGYLSSAMLKEMLKDSKAILASHRCRHELSRFMEEAALIRDLGQSKKQLEEEFKTPVRDIAFPFGSVYACSSSNIRTAANLFDHVLMTYPLPYNEEDGNTLPRININDANYAKEIR